MEQSLGPNGDDLTHHSGKRKRKTSDESVEEDEDFKTEEEQEKKTKKKRNKRQKTSSCRNTGVVLPARSLTRRHAVSVKCVRLLIPRHLYPLPEAPSLPQNGAVQPVRW
ncbi:unnamed protein product [Peronospora farinosa]|uniref:Uncharacterized protein n=1 Tax=Peronospora farinosa TaxID=134698 RepID=A0AAV0U5F8_9STRA|nr:unnamed protein product [Peronospora farinosa]